MKIFSNKKVTDKVKPKDSTPIEDAKNDMIILAKVDTIYLPVRSKPPIYFTKLKVLILIVMTLMYSLLWFLFMMISKTRNNIYCFSTSSQEFNVCDPDNVCISEDQGVTNYVYDSDFPDIKLSSITSIDELTYINNKFRYYFYQEYLLFSRANYDMVNKYDVTLDYFNNVLVMTYNENFNLFLTFRQNCSRMNLLIELGIFLFSGFTIGNILVCFLADVYGRKRILIQNC